MESTTPPYNPGPDRAQESLRESIRNKRSQAERWLLLKPTIQRLLSRDGRNRKTHSEVVKILKEQYGFDALYVYSFIFITNSNRQFPDHGANLFAFKRRR
jgi:hypothetical protein